MSWTGRSIKVRLSRRWFLKRRPGCPLDHPAVAPASGGSGHRIVPRPCHHVCGLCGRVFVVVAPPGEPETERDKLCPECAMLPAAPVGNDC
jgi:hypothetical protein